MKSLPIGRLFMFRLKPAERFDFEKRKSVPIELTI